MKSDKKYEILSFFESTVVHIIDVLGDRTTTNVQLFKFCKILFGDRFTNVYSSDDKFRLKNDQCCIINTDSHLQHGTHWLSIYKHNNSYYVFDSFGRDVHTLSKYFKHKNWINVNFERFESFKQSNCGQLAVAFLVTFDKYKTKCIGVI
jgi:hypothetical protein